MAGLKVYGSPACPDCRRSKQFLGEMRVPYEWIDIGEDEAAAAVARELNGGKQIIPTIVFEDGSVLAEPSNSELARKLGLQLRAERSFYDLVIVGGGPTGLAASIYAAREGIDCLVLDASALGGQAGTTERIDNYPGFPEGIGGVELVERFVQQARRYDVTLLPAVSVTSISQGGANIEVLTETGDGYCGRAIIIATGSTYRRLGVPGEDDLIGAGIHFCSTCDAPFYKGSKELMVIGGGNSAAEEGLYMSTITDKVTILEASPQLRASALLREKLQSKQNIDVRTNMEVTEFKSNGKLSAVLAKDRVTGEVEEFHPAAVFVFIGLMPNTSFLGKTLELDEWGFIKTDETLQTSMPGVYAAGDVRAGSTKQLASASGEGATALLSVRHYLRALGDIPAKLAPV